MTKKRRVFLAVFACAQNALIGGIVFGWASIDRTMLKATENEGGADLAPSQTTQLFTYASSTSMLSTLFLGPLLDAYGPRICLMVSQTLVLIGCACFSRAEYFWQFIVGVFLMAFGGPGMGISIIHVANLFAKNQFLAVSCLSGSVTLSFTILAVLNAIWEAYQTSFRALFGGYCVIIMASMVGTLICSPDDPYELDESSGDDADLDEEEYHPSLEREYIEATIQTYGHHHKDHFLLTDESLNGNLRIGDIKHADDETTQEEFERRRRLFLKRHSFFQSEKALQSGDEAVARLVSWKDQSFYVQVTSPTFTRAIVVFVATSFLANFTIASLTTELEDLSGRFTPLEQHSLSQQFTWLLSLGMFYAVLVGWLMDNIGLEICTLLTLLLGQVSTLLMLIAGFFMSKLDDYTTMIVGFCLYSLFRQFLFPVFLAYITARLGFKYFGILSGIGFALSGMAQWFMATLVQFVHHSGDSRWWMGFHIFQISILAVLMIIPIVDHKEIQTRQAQMDLALEQWSLTRSNKSPPQSTSSTATTAANTSPLWRDHQRSRYSEYDSLLQSTSERGQNKGSE